MVEDYTAPFEGFCFGESRPAFGCLVRHSDTRFSGTMRPDRILPTPCGADPFYPWGTRSMTGCRVAGQVPMATTRERVNDSSGRG